MNKEKEKFEEHAKKHKYLVEVNEKGSISKDIANILEKLKNNKKIKMVDIGSGDGNLAITFVNNKKVDLTVTDISETRLKRIKQITKNKLSNYVQDDINNSKLKSNYFDFVNSDMVIEHVPSDKKMLKEVNRILKKNGYFRISTVFKKGFSFWFYRNNGNWVIDPTHVREYSSQKEIKKLFQENNLTILEIKKEKLTFNPFIFIQKKLKIKINFLEKIKIQKPGYYSIIIIGKK
jgi:2-polyprenyl-3-methyl-5-hydroxy-6-metoxy-1,4-benzoquinol methylase